MKSMNERPLFIDVSSHQTFLNLAKSYTNGNDVRGIIMRAGYGLVKDVDFEGFDSYYDWSALWRVSYWALHPQYDVRRQVDKWLEVDPNGTHYMMDCEVTGELAPGIVADGIVYMSEAMFLETGIRPWIYGGYWFLMTNLIPFVTAEWLNLHKFVLAQYDVGDGVEYEGINLPDKIDIDNVIFKQTTNKLELYPGSGYVDRDRFLLGGIDELNDFMSGGFPVDPPVEDCCDELSDEVDMLSEISEAHMALIETNTADIKEHSLAIDSLDSQVKALGLGIAELYKRLDAVTKEQDAISETVVGENGVYERIEELEGKIHELENKTIPETNHSHWWMRLFSKSNG